MLERGDGRNKFRAPDPWKATRADVVEAAGPASAVAGDSTLTAIGIAGT